MNSSSASSGHLEKIQQFLIDWGTKAGVEVFKDPADNIVMRKPATPGMENRKGVILQAHMDMVPQKTPESTHNFETDPIEPWIDGEWVKAKGTTLGADDGLGVAAIMAVMESKDMKHGPVEALITADEETGMFGANALPAGELQGDILFNLDSETWGKFVIGSAGGIDITATLDYKEVETDPEDAAVKITLKGLRGGHSGLEIHEGRANANKQLVRVVREAIEECEARLACWQGGNMRNAIPFKAEAVLTLPKENVEALKELVADWKEDLTDQFRHIETGVELIAEDVETPKMEVPVEIQDNLINAMYGCHDGVLRMIPAYPDVVETSSNLAIINIGEGKASFKILGRSSREDMKDYLVKSPGNWKHRLLIIGSVALLFLLSDFVVSSFIKNVICRPRPSHDPAVMSLLSYVNDYRGGAYGFPSNHASNGFATATFLALLFRNRWVTLSTFLWAVGSCYSRMYLGVHYPTDILCGALLGTLFAFLVFILYKKAAKRLALLPYWEIYVSREMLAIPFIFLLTVLTLLILSL